jgi:hypothetical protein
MKNVQTNRVGKEARIKRVMDLMTSGYMTFQIIDICKKEWNVTSNRAIERYITYVYNFLKLGLKDIDRERILVEYQGLITKYENMGDYKLAKEYRFQRDKIFGVVVNKTDVTSGGEKLGAVIVYIDKPNGDKI